MDIFFELHQGIRREGPGNRAATRRIFESLQLPTHLQILDVGCGPGDQTLELARCSQASITAVDTHAPFLQVLRDRAKAEGVDTCIHTLQASMFDLAFTEDQFDLIWSEGAIYIMGFEKGLRAWRKFVQPEGYVVVSELSWLTNSPSAAPLAFWNTNYPEMQSTNQNLEIIRKCGYKLVGYDVLPEEGWWDDYYNPLQVRISALRSTYTGDAEATATLDKAQSEIDLYRDYSKEYGYVFYMMKKIPF